MPVNKIEGGSFDNFTGKVTEVLEEAERPNPKNPDESFPPQFKLTIETSDTEKGVMYEWIKFPGAGDKRRRTVGSIMDRYMEEIERFTSDDELKEMNDFKDYFEFLVGKTFEWKRKALGRSFTDKNGITHQAKQTWVPVKLIQ